MVHRQDIGMAAGAYPGESLNPLKKVDTKMKKTAFWFHCFLSMGTRKNISDFGSMRLIEKRTLRLKHTALIHENSWTYEPSKLKCTKECTYFIEIIGNIAFDCCETDKTRFGTEPKENFMDIGTRTLKSMEPIRGEIEFGIQTATVKLLSIHFCQQSPVINQ